MVVYRSCSQEERLPLARQSLVKASQCSNSKQAKHVLLEREYTTGKYGSRNAAFAACQRWICSFLQASDIATETAILSDHKLPACATTESLDLDPFAGLLVSCKLTAEHRTRGAGGRKVLNDKELPAILKKGPDTWLVLVEVGARAMADPISIYLRIRWDEYCQQASPKLIYNLLRVDEFCDPANKAVAIEPFLQWCSNVKTAATHFNALLDSPAYQPEQQQLAIADVQTAQHADAGATVAQQPDILSSKRTRSSDPGDCMVRECTISCSKLIERLEALEGKLDSWMPYIESWMDQQAVSIDRIKQQLKDHNDDLVHVQLRFARGEARSSDNSSSSSMAPSTPASQCSLWVHTAAITGGSGDGSRSDNGCVNGHHPALPASEMDFGTQQDLSSFDLDFDLDELSIDPPAGPSASSAARPAMARPKSASSVACPSFSGNVTKEQLQPFVLEALRHASPRSCSALDLTRVLWPNGNSAVRHAMKTLITGVLYSLEGQLIKNGTHWSIA